MTSGEGQAGLEKEESRHLSLVTCHRGGRHGPPCEREAVDLGVVAHVHGEFRVEIEAADGGGVCLRQCERAQFAGESLAGGGIFEPGLDDERGMRALRVT